MWFVKKMELTNYGYMWVVLYKITVSCTPELGTNICKHDVF